jgi:hypothetical protein
LYYLLRELFDFVSADSMPNSQYKHNIP